MNKLLCLLSFLLLSISGFSTINIICPSDQNVHLFELDTNYESYGDPQVDSQGTYELDKVISKFQDGCNAQYTIIRYTATNEIGESSACAQRIEIIRPVLDDIDLPENIDFDGITIEEAQSDISAFPAQWELLLGQSNIAGTYEDQVLLPSAGLDIVKILRQWTFLDWCTTEVLEHNQLIRIVNYSNSPGFGLFNIQNCYGKPVEVLDYDVSTDQINFQINTDSCELIGSDITSYLNCIAENNDISSDQSFILKLKGSEEYLNGVSTLDIVLSQRHILAIKPFTEQCNILAADINADGYVTAFDLLLMRKLILGIIIEFPNSPAWKILNAKILNQNLSVEEKDLTFKKEEFPLQNLELIAIKTGDVNGTSQ